MRRLYPARCWDVWCLVEVPGAGMPEPRVGQLVLSEGAHYQDGRGPMGVPDGSFVPAGGGMHGSSMPGAGKPMTSAGTPGALRGCLLPGCSVSSRGARWVGCPVGMPSGEGARWWGCPVAGYPVLAGDAQYGGSRAAGWPEPGGGARRRGCGGPGRGGVLTAALEALPAAAPDEVPAEIAPGVQPAAPRLEAVPGARCRRQPRVRMRPGTGPAGRADAQRVSPFQAAPARPRLRLQLPQLDELHGPAAAGAARWRGGGRHRAGAGTGRGRPDGEPRGN